MTKDDMADSDIHHRVVDDCQTGAQVTSYADRLMQTAKKFDDDRLSNFKKYLQTDLDTDEPGGRNAKQFALGVSEADPEQLPDGLVSRSFLFGLVERSDIKTATICAAIMAWGGMRMNHRDMVAGDGEWLTVADRIRHGDLTRQAAYEELQKLRAEGRLKGMGPAFFTKLIYFLSPRPGSSKPQAYIMDQWAGCSINLMAGKNIVLMDTSTGWHSSKGVFYQSSNFRVSNANGGEHYEEFCLNMDALARECDKTADQIDRAVLGSGGRQKDIWRKYVIEHRRPL